ncbi:MAG: TRAP transporter small permease [Desulfuromusa sp.]|nr:TRAP transporter small permease [Desulfuromusa sp.]
METTDQSRLHQLARKINWLIERICALLVGVMVVIIWFEVIERYFLHWGFTWTEELSRYVMIWAALLAISCGAFYREHIGLDIVGRFLPEKWARILSISLDLISIAFFLFLAWYGIGMAKSGLGQYATIFGMTMVVPFAAVPISSVLTAFQIFAAMVRGQKTIAISMTQ